jgi:hypothetical protein
MLTPVGIIALTEAQKTQHEIEIKKQHHAKVEQGLQQAKAQLVSLALATLETC